MARFKSMASILILVLFLSACQTGEDSKTVPSTPPQKKEHTMAQKDEIYIGREKVRNLRPAGEYFLYPGPDPVFLALPQAVVIGGSVVEVIETKGEWVHLKSGEDQGWLPKWYLEVEKDAPVKDIEADYKVLKENCQGLLYPDGPVTVTLEKGKLAKPIKEWGDWYFVGIIVYDIPAVQCAWIPKEALVELGETESREGFLHEGTEVYGFENFEKHGPENPEKLQNTMTVYVIMEKEGYIAVQAAGGWTAWTKKENLKFQYDSR